jgi:hypothetical protein
MEVNEKGPSLPRLALRVVGGSLGVMWSVEVLDTFVNQDLSAVTVEFLCGITNPPCTLRIVDRLKVNDEGEIVEQENFFDPRDVTNPGWQDA